MLEREKAVEGKVCGRQMDKEGTACGKEAYEYIEPFGWYLCKTHFNEYMIWLEEKL